MTAPTVPAGFPPPAAFPPRAPRPARRCEACGEIMPHACTAEQAVPIPSRRPPVVIITDPAAIPGGTG